MMATTKFDQSSDLRFLVMTMLRSFLAFASLATIACSLFILKAGMDIILTYDLLNRDPNLANDYTLARVALVFMVVMVDVTMIFGIASARTESLSLSIIFFLLLAILWVVHAFGHHRDMINQSTEMHKDRHDDDFRLTDHLQVAIFGHQEQAEENARRLFVGHTICLIVAAVFMSILAVEQFRLAKSKKAIRSTQEMSFTRAQYNQNCQLAISISQTV